jgi:hypothetical protein
MPKRGSFSTQFEFKGVEQIQRLMEGMDLREQTKVLEGALSEASKPIVEASRVNLLSYGPNKRGGITGIRTGALLKSMGFIIKNYRNRGKLIAYIGARHMAFAGNISNRTASVIRDTRPLGPDETKVVPSKYIHLFHNGFKNKLTGTRVPPRPFLKDAFDANIVQEETTLASGAVNALEKIWKRNVERFNRSIFKKAA